MSNTKNGWVISKPSTTTLEIRVQNPGCFPMGFPLDKLNAYINHLYVENPKDLEASVVFRDILMHHTCGHVTSFDST